MKNKENQIKVNVIAERANKQQKIQIDFECLNDLVVISFVDKVKDLLVGGETEFIQITIVKI